MTGSKRFTGLLLLCAALALPVPARAAHPLLTDDTGTQGTGKFQLEASGTWLSDRSNANGVATKEIDSFAAVVLTGGITDTLDLAATVLYVWTETNEAGTKTRESGISDTVIEAKWRLFEKEKLSLAVKPGIVVPTGSDEKGLGTGHVGYTAFLLSTYEEERWAIDANLGNIHLENRIEERVDRWFASVASRYRMAEHWNIVGEIGAARSADPTDNSHPAFAQAGFICSPKDNLDLSAGYVFGLNDAEIDHTIRVGVTARF